LDPEAEPEQGNDDADDIGSELEPGLKPPHNVQCVLSAGQIPRNRLALNEDKKANLNHGEEAKMSKRQLQVMRVRSSLRNLTAEEILNVPKRRLTKPHVISSTSSLGKNGRKGSDIDPQSAHAKSKDALEFMLSRDDALLSVRTPIPTPTRTYSRGRTREKQGQRTT
jgi:hypothetical protein